MARGPGFGRFLHMLGRPNATVGPLRTNMSRGFPAFPRRACKMWKRLRHACADRDATVMSLAAHQGRTCHRNAALQGRFALRAAIGSCPSRRPLAPAKAPVTRAEKSRPPRSLGPTSAVQGTGRIRAIGPTHGLRAVVFMPFFPAAGRAGGRAREPAGPRSVAVARHARGPESKSVECPVRSAGCWSHEHPACVPQPRLAGRRRADVPTYRRPDVPTSRRPGAAVCRCAGVPASQRAAVEPDDSPFHASSK